MEIDSPEAITGQSKDEPDRVPLPIIQSHAGASERSYAPSELTIYKLH
jgi:hypothetical protein